MQDIDFDELDRAVNSVSTADVPVSESVPVTVNSGTHAADVHAPTTSPSSTPAVRPTTGRFMDVVHPSSDMRPNVPPAMSRPAPRPVQEEKPAERTNDWPDPLDFHGYNPEPVVNTPPAPVEVVEEVVPAIPLESPFLSDAKIEKRPLGAFSTSETPTAPLETPAEEPEQLIEAPESVELVEAENPVTSEPADESLLVSEELEVTEPTPEPAPVEEISTGPTSITQQYKEQPNTTAQPSGAIYDTESYHKPLVHVPQKKSGAIVIVWIAALILVGAGAGAAVYFLVLPML